MRWVRNNIRHGSWLALIALVVNLGLSFGHVHAINGKPAQQSSPVASIAAGHGHQTPGHPDDGQADYLCPICMAATAMANALTATPPVLQLEFVDASVDRAIEPTFAVVEPPAAAFQSRGPPIS